MKVSKPKFRLKELKIYFKIFIFPLKLLFVRQVHFQQQGLLRQDAIYARPLHQLYL